MYDLAERATIGTMAAPLAAALDGTTPLCRKVKRPPTRALADARRAPGEALPSESRLPATLGVSSGTLRMAPEERVAERMLPHHQGSGWARGPWRSSRPPRCWRSAAWRSPTRADEWSRAAAS